ncbi:MAG: alpha/beta hydrolase family esterase [Thermoleophilaceae bacterium]
MRSSALPILVAFLTGVLAGCGNSGGATDAKAPSACAANAFKPGDHAVFVNSGGQRRFAIVHVPRGESQPLPVYLVLHFAGGRARAMERLTGLSKTGEEEGFLAVYPEADGARHFWTLHAAAGRADDVAFIGKLLDRLEQVACVDTRRVYATGVSNGGGMAALLACRMANRIAAVAPVAGGYSQIGQCAPARPVSVLEIHGTGDRIVPYDGRPPERLGSVPRYLAGWVGRDGCPPKARRRPLGGRGAIRYDWGPCRDGTAVAHIKAIGAGHGLPPHPPFQGKAGRFDATAAIVRFFQAHPRGG